MGIIALVGLVTVLGTLAFLRLWGEMARVLIADASLRLALVLGAANLSDSPATLMSAIALPAFAWLPILLGTRTGQVVKAQLRTKVIARAFLSRAGISMVATGSASLLVAGFPWLLAISHESTLEASSAGLLAALVLFRSPVIVVVYAVRPVVLRSLVERKTRPLTLMRTIAPWGLVAGAVVTLVAFAVGPIALRLMLGDGFEVSGAQASTLTLSAVLFAGAALETVVCVAYDLHSQTAIAWIAAVIVTVAVLQVPMDLAANAQVATMVGPICALAFMTATLMRVPGSVETQRKR